MSSAKSILKSTSLIGGSSVISILFQIIKGKFIAVLLGPTGTGLIGALQSSVQLVQQVAGFGVQNSAVRDIAQASSKNDSYVISQSIQTLRRVVLFTGLLGMVLTVAFAPLLSKFTFGTEDYIWEIRILSVTVLFNLIKGGQGALLQGLRKIKTLAKMTIWSSFLGTLISIPVLYFFEMDGVALYLVLLALGQLIVSFYYARQVNIEKINLTFREVLNNAQGMLKLGAAFMGGGFVIMTGAYLIRVILIRTFDLEAAGIYQAATTVSTVYIGIILQAMGKDFYPRLASVPYESKEENRIINEQIEIGVYLAAPGLLFTLALAPIGISILYSTEFLEATLILQWMILGIFLRTIIWPMGYLFIARAKTNIFFINQIVPTIVHLIFIYLFLNKYGLVGSGIAFLMMYLFHLAYMFMMTNKESQFRWNKSVTKTLFLFSAIFVISFLVLYFTNDLVGGIIVVLIACGVSFLTLNKVLKILDVNNYSDLLHIVKNKLGK